MNPTLALVFVTALVALVAIVAIVFGRQFQFRVKDQDKSAELNIDVKDELGVDETTGLENDASGEMKIG